MSHMLEIIDREARLYRSTAAEPAAAVDPVDLWGNFDPPELPPGLLPPIIEEFARVTGYQMGADPAGLAVAALVTCAASIPDQVVIRVKRHSEWTESARIWAALVGPPSTKKSPILSAATGPLCRLDIEMMRDWQHRMAVFFALPKEERKGKLPPPQTRLRLEDSTPEAAQEVLAGSPWGVLGLQDELGGWFSAMDRYHGGRGADRAFWLRCFNGGAFAVNRIGRGATIIDNASASILGGVQPDLIRRIADGTVDDGLMQRFFFVMLRPATLGQDEPAPPIGEAYAALIGVLRGLKLPGRFGQPLEFDDAAQTIRRGLEGRHLRLQSTEAVTPKLSAHIGKFDGLFARLCIVWHCVEHAEKAALCAEPGFDGAAMSSTITASTAQRVADFLHRFLLPHAIAFYAGVLGVSNDHDRLTAVAGYILAHALEMVTNRDVQRGDRTMRALRDFETKLLFEQLSALGWLDRIDPPRPSSPPHWRVNPAVHLKFAAKAKREANRREEARSIIAEVMSHDAVPE